MPDRPVRQVSWFTVDRPALVLGSTQPSTVVDSERAARAGFEVVRRRSGGGAVLLVPGDVWWVDIVVPSDDPLWSDDVGRSFHWLGEVWASVVGDLGAGTAEVHRSGLRKSLWSPLVCFAGLGPGEVTVDGRKVVGMAQRRSRLGARFQCALLGRWDPTALIDVLVLAAAERQRAAHDLADVAIGIHPLRSPVGQSEDAAALIERSLLARLPL